MVTSVGHVPEQGQLVQVRSRPWVVNEVKPSTLPYPAMELPVAKPQDLLTFSSVEVDGLGEELQVVWEIEPGATISERVATTVRLRGGCWGWVPRLRHDFFVTYVKCRTADSGNGRQSERDPLTFVKFEPMVDRREYKWPPNLPTGGLYEQA